MTSSASPPSGDEPYHCQIDVPRGFIKYNYYIESILIIRRIIFMICHVLYNRFHNLDLYRCVVSHSLLTFGRSDIPITFKIPKLIHGMST